MILDCLENLDLYIDVHPLLEAACEFLRGTDLRALPDGRHEIDGDRLFLMLATSKGKGRRQALLEAHRRYIDIQIVLDGHEEIGWKPLADCQYVREAYDEEKDIAFFADESPIWLDLHPGTLAIFFPSDAHAPLAGRGQVRKAVFKIAVEAE